MQIEGNKRKIIELFGATDADDNVPDSSKTRDPNCWFAKGSSQSKLSENHKQHWSYVLKVFEPIKNVPTSSINITKPLRKSGTSNYRRKTPSQRSSILNSTQRESFNMKNVAICKKDLKLRGSEGIDRENCDKENLSKSRTTWSSNDESDDCKGNARTILFPNSSKHHEHAQETQIVWSSSNESDDSNVEISGYKSNLSAISLNSECELNLFIAEIEKDLRQTNRKKQKLHVKKSESLLEESRIAIERGKSGKRFLNYEQQAGILKGLSAVVMEVKPLYGVCAVNVKLESGNQCCFLLRDCTQSVKVGSSLVSFADYSKKYMINGVDVFIQPNKIVES